MSAADVSSVLDRQLLLQLGDRLKRLRQEQGLGTVEMAARVGITRNTLRAIEAGDPSPSMGTYLRVMSVLGVSAELALLAGDSLQPAPAGSAAARSHRAGPVVKVHVMADDGRHQLQDLQSLALHEEAVRRVKSDPTLVAQALETVQRWAETGDRRSVGLWREWEEVLRAGTWRKILNRTRRAQQMRQTSPLVTVLPAAVRKEVLDQVAALRKGVELSGGSPSAVDAAHAIDDADNGEA
jgi:transcriptional regulator with XRE-family HTH domain